jgi:hypothetical protein
MSTNTIENPKVVRHSLTGLRNRVVWKRTRMLLK